MCNDFKNNHCLNILLPTIDLIRYVSFPKYWRVLIPVVAGLTRKTGNVNQRRQIHWSNDKSAAEITFKIKTPLFPGLCASYQTMCSCKFASMNMCLILND